MAKQRRNDLLAAVKGLLTSGAHADFIIECGDEKFKVHKAIISSRSRYLATAVKFGKEAEKSKIVLVDDDPRIVKLMIQYLYRADYEPFLPEEEESKLEDKGNGGSATEVMREFHSTLHRSPLHSSSSHLLDSYRSVYRIPSPAFSWYDMTSRTPPPPPTRPGFDPSSRNRVSASSQQGHAHPSTSPRLVASTRFPAYDARAWDPDIRGNHNRPVTLSTPSTSIFPHTCNPIYQVSIPCRLRILCIHHRCGVSCSFSCRNFICKECHPPRSNRDIPLIAPENEKPSDLLTHAHVYTIADKYNMLPLKDLATTKFKRACSFFWNEEAFIQAAEYVFQSTLDQDMGLRAVIIETIKRHEALEKKQEVEDLVIRVPRLAWCLWKGSLEGKGETSSLICLAKG